MNTEDIIKHILVIYNSPTKTPQDLGDAKWLEHNMELAKVIVKHLEEAKYAK